MQSLQLQLQLPSCFSYCHYSSGDSFGLSLTFQPHPSQQQHSRQPQGFAAMTNTIIFHQICGHRLIFMIIPQSPVDLCQDPTCNQASSAGSHVISALCSLPVSSSSRPSEHRSSKKPHSERCARPTHNWSNQQCPQWASVSCQEHMEGDLP